MPATPFLNPLNYLLFCLGALSLIMSPGPDFFYVSSRGLAGGRSAGIVSAFGIGTGLLFHTLVAATGLTFLLKLPLVFNVVKWIGAGYLLWMGYKILSSHDAFAPTPAAQVANLRTVFRQAVLTNIFNPKVTLTFAFFILPFVDQHQSGAAWRTVALGLTLATLATTWFCFVGASMGHLGAFLARKPSINNFVRIFSGILLVGLGINVAFPQIWRWVRDLCLAFAGQR